MERIGGKKWWSRADRGDQERELNQTRINSWIRVQPLSSGSDKHTGPLSVIAHNMASREQAGVP